MIKRGSGPKKRASRSGATEGGGAGSSAGGPKKRAPGGPPPKNSIPPKTPSRTTKSSPVKPKTRRGPAPSPLALRHRANEVWRRLAALYPDAHCELDYRSPWELLVATILSAQCTDKRVNLVTPDLFARWPSPGALAAAPVEDVEAVIKSTGFFRAKAKALVGVASAVCQRHGGAVPPRMDDLTVLPGVGRKTANVVLGNAFNINDGVVVDTHVGRLALRLGLTKETDPVKVEHDLAALFDRDNWTLLSHLLIWHGRRVCDARKPRCGDCSLRDICPSALVQPASLRASIT